jgi:hypothetical protein
VPFGRRGSPPADEVPATADAQPDEGAAKGRPTPKRADARKARRSPTSGNSKEAANAKRQQGRTDRQRARQALVSGDERYLPPRDAGPERRLARDIVDTRFTYGQVFVFIVVIVFILGTFITNDTMRGIANIIGLVSLTVIVLDSARHGRAAKLAVADKYPNSAVRGISSYAFMRAMLPRRFRRPPPKVKRGGAAV